LLKKIKKLYILLYLVIIMLILALNLGSNQFSVRADMINLSSTTSINFDISKGSVSITDSAYSGNDGSGSLVSGIPSDNFSYVISQSSSSATTNTITVNITTGNVIVVLNGVNIQTSSGCAMSVTNTSPSTVSVILKDNTKNYLYSAKNRAGLEKSGGTTSDGLLLLTCEKGYSEYIKDDTKGHTDSNGYSGCDSNCGHIMAKSGNAWNKTGTANTYYGGAGIGTKGYGTGGSNKAGVIAGDNALVNFHIAGGNINAVGGRGQGADSSSNGSSGGGANIGTGSAATSSSTAGTINGFRITGGTFDLYRSDNSASCIGGGYRAGYVNMEIYGGTISTTDDLDPTKDKSTLTFTGKARASGIGGGGGGTSSSSPAGATVTIYGGLISAESKYGAAIGAGAGGSTGNGEKAYVTIKGGNITAITTKGDGNGAGAGIGTGGSLGTGKGGEANVTIEGGIINASSELGADIGGGGTNSNQTAGVGGNGNVIIKGGTITALTGGIGGGKANTGNGGDAVVNISGGVINAYAIGGGDSNNGNGGNATVNVNGDANVTLTDIIGGGNSASGNGGNASVTVSGGKLVSSGIGGGNSSTGNPGSITGINNNPGINISGGTIITGSIGGGVNNSGAVGYASAVITGGDIIGQFIMKASSLGSCSFVMSGGIIHDNDVINDSKYTQVNGGAVYMDDPNGVGELSGGTITSSSSENGGAVYMTAGLFTLSGTGVISSCTVNSNGGAVYLGQTGSYKGEFVMTGGTISNNSSTNGNGGAIYLDGGTATISGGIIDNNSGIDGGALYLNGGSLNISGGTIINNTASNYGGAAYVNEGSAEISGGIIGSATQYNSAVNGGALYLNSGTLNISGGNIDSNKASNSGGGAYVNGGSLNMTGGTFTSNKASNSGGGAYVTNGNFTMNGSSSLITKNTAVSGGGVLVSGGNVTIINGSITYNTATNNGGGVSVTDGNYSMHGGLVDNNKAESGYGGGIYVEANNEKAIVEVLSGTISNNYSNINGGALSVVGAENITKEIEVTIGVNEVHDCSHGNYGSTTCPVIKNNKSELEGGAIYITGTITAKLNIFCLEEENNVALGEKESRSDFLKVEGGKVLISCADEGSGDDLGKIVVNNSVHVTSGQVDIYGSMENPKFNAPITVDITSNEDYYNDHRTSDGKFYKLQYFENFWDPVLQNYTGQYTAYQFKENETHDILGVIYSHPGYEIIGWANEDRSYEYLVGETITMNEELKGLDKEKYILKLYANWDAHGYFIKFDANRNTYYGEMENNGLQTCTYDTEVTLFENKYGVISYQFVSWNTKKDGTGTSYDDKEVVKNLSERNGDTVILYAQWILCDHSDKYLDYYASSNVIHRDCSCLDFSDFVNVNNESVVYDGNNHEVILEYSNLETKTTWPSINIVYNNDISVTPLNAGSYDTVVTVDGKDLTLELVFIINKADQAAPNKPTYEPEINTGDNTSKLKVDKIEDSAIGTKAEFQVKYYDNNGDLVIYTDILGNEWLKVEDGESIIEFSMNFALTTYFIYARYEGTENYNPSKIVSADTVYFYPGKNIQIKITYDDGISFLYEPSDGIMLLIDVEDGYFRLNGDKTNVSVNKKEDGVTTIVDTNINHRIESGQEIWQLTAVADGTYELLIHISGVGRMLKFALTGESGEEFGKVNDSIINISRDSAFTSYFVITNYTLANFGKLSLEYSTELPVGTTIILIDKPLDGGNYNYYFYKITTNSKYILLDDFSKMGSTGNFEYNDLESINLQVITDFKNVTLSDLILNDDISISLDTEKNDNCIYSKNSKTANLNTISVSIESSDSKEEVTNNFEITSNINNINSSKLDDLELSIVINPKGDIPEDAYFDIKVNNNTYYVHKNNEGKYISKIGKANENEFIVKTKLVSLLFPTTDKEYLFDIYLYSACDGDAPMNGTLLYNKECSFIKNEETFPSIKIECDDKVFDVGDVFKAKISYLHIPTDCTVKATIMKKSQNNTYESTAWSASVNITPTASYTELDVNLAGQINGSYCLLVEVKNNDGFTVELSVPYYFVIR